MSLLDAVLPVLALGALGWAVSSRARKSAANAGSSPSTSHLGAACRPFFFLDWQFAHVNHGSYGVAPRPVVAAAAAALVDVEAFPDHFMRRRVAGEWKAAADAVGRAVNAPAGSVVLVENATTAVNAVLRSLPPSAAPGAGPELWVMLDQTYNACALALRAEAAARGPGVAVAVLPVALPAADGAAVVAALAASLAAALRAAGVPRARFLLLDHIASATGMLFPLADLLAALRPMADLILVDGAHAPGQLDLDMAALVAAGADWYTGNLHKWAFASKGTAFLFCRDELQAAQRPLVVSHLIGARDWRDRFWMQGTADFSRALTAPAALAFMRDEIGVAAMRAYNTRLCAAATARLCALWGTAPLLPADLAAPFMRSIETPLDWRAFLDAPPAPGAAGEAAALAAALADTEAVNQRVAGAVFRNAGVQGQFAFWVVAGRGAVYCRISCQVYNVMEDYERLGAAVLALKAATSAPKADRHW
jgi:isopenicillin-N epimerase